MYDVYLYYQNIDTILIETFLSTWYIRSYFVAEIFVSSFVGNRRILLTMKLNHLEKTAVVQNKVSLEHTKVRNFRCHKVTSDIIS